MNLKKNQCKKIIINNVLVTAQITINNFSLNKIVRIEKVIHQLVLIKGHNLMYLIIITFKKNVNFNEQINIQIGLLTISESKLIIF